MSFDIQARRYNDSYDSSKLHNPLRSPEGGLNSSILRNKNDLAASTSRGRSLRGNSVSKKVSYADSMGYKSSSTKDEIDISERPSSRKTTPKKYYFFSDYMRDYTPSLNEYKSPTGNDFRPILPDQRPLETLNERLNQSRGPTSSRKEYGSHYDSKEHLNRTPDTYATDEAYRRWRSNNSPTRHVVRSPARENDEELERKLRENKKEEIKERLLRLSDKLYSPLRNTGAERSRGFNRSGSKEGFGGQDHTLTHENYTSTLERSDTEFRNTRTENSSSGFDVKQRIMIQEYENSISNLKTHLEKVERNNSEIVSKLRDELRQVREELTSQRLESNIRNTDEVRNLHDKARDLEENLNRERDEVRKLEEKLEDTRTLYEKKLSDMTKDVERIKNEKERKLDELNNQLKSQNQNHRDVIGKNRTECETQIKRLREEHNIAIRELNSQIEKKTAELEKSQREKSDALGNLNEKMVSLQEVTKHNQDTYTKLTRTIELKDDEIDKLHRRLNDTKKDCSILAKQAEELNQDKLRLEEENERLKSKTARLEKMIYGKAKITPE